MLTAFKGDREDFACAESSFFETNPRNVVCHLVIYGVFVTFLNLYRNFNLTHWEIYGARTQKIKPHRKIYETDFPHRDMLYSLFVEYGKKL